ncbi:MAG: hypothetical protein C3F12_09070 [Candidatus Methylomirabilota bacterium]|nr:MAG: hypothetical protein C3F12_09070 [candidate division NC10 bacterium]
MSMALIDRITRSRLGPDELAYGTLRSLSLIGGLIALFLVPVRPEHGRHLAPLFVGFLIYKALLFASVRLWPERVRTIFIWTTYIDLTFVFVFIWFTGGLDSHFYLLYYLLIALDAYYFGSRVALSASITAGALYVGADLLSPPSYPHPGHLPARVSLMIFLGTALGLLSDRERLARQKAETLNVQLAERQASLERAYQHLRDTQRRLLHSERLAMVGKLAAKVAHEVRNPLSSISLNLELLEDEIAAGSAPPADQAKGLVSSIKVEIERLTEVTESYLRLARLPEPKLATESLGELLESLCDLLRGEMGKRQVKIEVRIDPGIPLVLVDRNQLRQAFINVLGNAFEAMPSGGLVTVSAKKTGGRVEIAFADEGPGVPADHLEKIFEPFFTTKAGGTGLGLAIAKEIVEAHGGQIHCSSRPGSGTVVAISLPLGEGEEDRGRA